MTGFRSEKTYRANKLVLDLQAANKAIGGNEELLRKMTAIFYDDMPRMTEILRQALTDGDIKMITQHAHTIKGASDNIKAKMMSEAAIRVEQAAINGSQQEAFGLFKKLEIELEKVRKALLESGLLDKN